MESKELKRSLHRRFGPERAAAMITMMQTGELVGSEGDELHDFLTEGLLNDAKA
jgi:hypothetical protein